MAFEAKALVRRITNATSNLKFNFISLDVFSTSSSLGSRKMTGVICEINYKKCKGS